MFLYMIYIERKIRHALLISLGCLGLILPLSGCEPAEEINFHPFPVDENHSTSSPWSRTVDTVKGPVTLTHKPARIVSTSITITGTLLAINAPIIASSATEPNTTLADNKGFFTQWSDIARARHLIPMYQTEPNIKAVAKMRPDLIIISATGDDSTLELYDQLSAIAPTLVINYDDKSWQELTLQLGQATGHEGDAEQVIDKFARRLNEVKQKITLPPQPVSAFVYQEVSGSAKLWTENSAQGRLLLELGFTLANVPDTLKDNTHTEHRKDIIQLGGDELAQGLNGKTILLFSGVHSAIDALKSNKFLTNLPAIQHDNVYAAGYDTFRLDYYSANNLLTRIESMFKGKKDSEPTYHESRT